MFVITDCMKVKIKIVRFTTEKAIKVRDAVEVWLYSFFSPGTRWGWVVSAIPQPLYPAPTVQVAVWAPEPV
jgi:hypothetical protein